MRHHASLLVAAALASAQLACSTDDNVNLGETKGSALVDYAADWKGHAEAFSFDPADPSTDAIRITINANGTGSLRVGDVAPYPPPTNYDVGYPVGVLSPLPPYPGLVYPLLDVRVEDRRLRFRFEASGPYADWCARQTPIRDRGDPSFWRCIDGYPIGNASGNICHVGQQGDVTLTDVDCGKAFLCNAGSLCYCSETGCEPRHDAVLTYSVDASLENSGSRLTGTLVMGERVTVKLERQ